MTDSSNLTAVAALRGTIQRLGKFLEERNTLKPVCREPLFDGFVRCGLPRGHEGLHEAEVDVLTRENALLMELLQKSLSLLIGTTNSIERLIKEVFK